MSKILERTDRLIRTTGRGSGHYGLCEKCGKPVSETFFAVDRVEWHASFLLVS